MIFDPSDMYEIHDERVNSGSPVLVVALQGFVDAGAAGRQVVEHLLETLPNKRLATFDADLFVDYRSRRPAMSFETNEWTGYEAPELVIDVVTDASGASFLLLHGSEPDLNWERFCIAVERIIDEFSVSLTVGVQGIPMTVPHTRPVSITPHATRRDLIGDQGPHLSAFQIPGSAQALLEYRLGRSGHDAVGYSANVPHYLAQARYPQAAEALIEGVSSLTGLDLPTATLAEAGRHTIEEIDRQVAESPEIQGVIAALEQQYDTISEEVTRPSLLEGSGQIPTADEIGAQFERYLAEQSGTDSSE